jgi:pseudaminic acid synthase
MAVTCYLPVDVSTIEPHTCAWKVASFEALAVDLRDAIAVAASKPLYLSVGMLDERATADAVRLWGGTGNDLTTMLCVSAYPSPVSACNLSLLRPDDFCGSDFDGFSDHTANVLTGAFAVCAGARIVEFHLRLDDSNPANPDYSCALSPSEAKRYVDLIRLAESAMGSGVKAMQECERPMSAFRCQP